MHLNVDFLVVPDVAGGHSGLLVVIGDVFGGLETSAVGYSRTAARYTGALTPTRSA